jgi:hypothetical protein
MDLESTLLTLLAAVGFVIFCNIMSRRPPAPGKVRLLPYTALQFIGLLLAVLMLGHLVTLLTGQPFKGRLSRW